MYVWLDSNGNGLQDPGDEPLAGVTIQLFDSDGNLVGTTITNDDGSYGFSNLAAGDYYVQFVAPAGLMLTKAMQGGVDTPDSDIDPQTLRSAVTAGAGGR